MAGQTQGTGEFPSDPRQVKAWLANLPLTHMGESTKLFFNGIHNLGKLDLPPGIRLDILEAMQPTEHLVFEHITRHLTNRTLPLHTKSRMLVDLSQALLTQLASCYRMVVHDTSRQGVKLGEERLALAIYRSTRHLGQLLQTFDRLYIPHPGGVWRGLHEMYSYAEINHLLDVPVNDADLGKHATTSVATAYKECCLLSLSNPFALRQGEVDRLAEFFRTHLIGCAITSRIVADPDATVIVINPASDEPPFHATAREVAESIAGSNRSRQPRRGETQGRIEQNTALRGLTVDSLIQELRTLSQRSEGEKSVSGVTPDLARRVLSAITTTPRRQFARSAKQDEIHVAFGVELIHTAIRWDRTHGTGTDLQLAPISVSVEKSPPAPNPPLQAQTTPFLELSLQPIDKDEVDESADDATPLSVSAEVDHNAQAWNMVAQGRFSIPTIGIDGLPELQTLVPSEAKLSLCKLINISAGGYCLHWDSEESCKALVGELIGIRETEGIRHSHWRIGVIRWMRFSPSECLKIGIQVYATDANPGEVHRGNLAIKHRGGGFIRGLQLQASEDSQHPATLIVPADAFHTGDEITYVLHEVSHGLDVYHARLAEIIERTSLFERYKYFEVGEETSETEHEDEFAGLWNRL